MTDDEYFNNTAMSQSKIKILLESPRLFYFKHILNIDMDDKHSASMQFGNCLDLALTEPDKYKELKIKNTKTTSLQGYITKEWQIKIDKMINELDNYIFEDDYFNGVTYKKIIQSCTMQDKLFYNYNDIDWKAKFDLLSIQNKLIIDIKSTRSITEKDFIKDFYKFGYHIQAGSYSIAFNEVYKKGYPVIYYIGISTVTGEIFVLQCTEDIIQYGIHKINKGCELYKYYNNNNLWLKQNNIVKLQLPEWLKKGNINE